MSDRSPARRPFSHGTPSLYPLPVSRRLVRAEADTQINLVLHELDVLSRQIKAEREIASNRRIVQRITDAELAYYDNALDKVGTSAIKHRCLAARMQLLTDLNDDSIDRFRR